MELNPSKSGVKPAIGKSEAFLLELKKLYKEFKSFGSGESQVIMINDPKGMMDRFKFGLAEFSRFAKLFNKIAEENNIPLYIKLERKNTKYYLCNKTHGGGFLGSVF
jgi:hypothetical protein